MKTTVMTRSLISGAVMAAMAGAGMAGAGQAGAVGIADLSVTQKLLPMGCSAVVTNIGGATARNVDVRTILFTAPVQHLGDIAPGESKSASYIDCAIAMLGVRVVATTSSLDSNPFNNVARIYP